MVNLLRISRFRSSARPWLLMVAAFTLASTGCGESTVNLPSVTTYPVKGKVQLVDGSSVPQGTITFYPKDSETGRVASGKIESDGSFSLVTSASQDGAAAGEYRLAVMSEASIPSATPGFGEPLVDPRFHDEDSSGLTVTVKPESNDLSPIILDPAKLPDLSPVGQFQGNRRDDPRDRG